MQLATNYCPGEIMAGNPKWNQDLKTWQSYFRKWIQDTQPQDILNVAIFFDFRCIYGEDSLIDQLRSHVNRTVESKSLFFHHVAQSIVKMKVSANLPGNLKAKVSIRHPTGYQAKPVPGDFIYQVVFHPGKTGLRQQPGTCREIAQKKRNRCLHPGGTQQKHTIF